MSWILIAVIAYMILAIVNLADKFLLEKYIASAKAYTFLIGLLSLLAFGLAPWYLTWPGLIPWTYDILVGAIFPVALLLMYKALKEGEASEVITVVGGSVPIFTLLLSVTIFGETFSPRQWLALGLLILGTIIISWFPDAHELWHKVKTWFSIESINRHLGLAAAISAGFLLSLFFIGSKYLYTSQYFWSAFIWIRLGTFLAALSLLIPGQYRREIFEAFRSLKRKNGQAIFFGTQGLAALGFLLQNYALNLGSVVIINALQGVQYVFLLILGALLTVFYPKLIKENISRSVIIKKLIAVAIIIVGLILIA